MPDPESPQRRVVLVVGAEPLSTATLAATLAALGAGDLATGETGRWVTDLHRELLDRGRIEIDDARPGAWFEAGKLSANGITRARLTEWLGRQFVHPDGERAGDPRPEVVVADPGLPWLLGLWRAAALRCDAEVAHVVVLRSATSVAQDAGGVASWLNRMLHVERATRDTPRVLLPYADVARDWTIPFVELGSDLDLRSVREATANQIRRGHDAIAAGPPEPEPSPSAPSAAPGPLRDLAEQAWSVLTASDDPDAASLDALRAAYEEAYTAAESITGSSLRAAVRAAAPAPAQASPSPAPPPVDSLRDQVRRGVRRTLGR